MIGRHRIAVKRVIALHVNGVVGGSAHTKVNEVVNVEAFARHAAIGFKQDAEGVGTAAKEHFWIGEVRDLLPGDLRVPRKVGPLAWSSAGIALRDVPGNGFKRIVEIT